MTKEFNTFLECKTKTNYSGAVISDSEGAAHERKMSCEEIVVVVL